MTAGTFHDFHLAWIAELRRALNSGILPAGYYAQAEQVAGETIPDVLTLQELGGSAAQDAGIWSDQNDGAVAVTDAPPRVSVTDTVSEALVLAAKRRRLVIRHTTGDRIVALLEIVSPGNKETRTMYDRFVEKAVAALEQGYHLLILDMFPPGRFDPAGMHGALWSKLGGNAYEAPPDRPLTLAAYAAAGAVTAYVEPLGLHAPLPDMPLFLDPGHYVPTPLEPTYMAAWEGMPQRWKRVIEA